MKQLELFEEIEPDVTYRVLNYGGGRQSTALLAMAVEAANQKKGIIHEEVGTLITDGMPGLQRHIEKLGVPDVVIHADTGHERSATYDYIEEVARPRCEAAGIPFVVVNNGSIKDDTLRSVREGTRIANAPYFVTKDDGKKGILRRMCTSEYKIKPIEREIKTRLGIAPGKRVYTKAKPNFVEQWIGIATEEKRRAKARSHRNWSRLVYPLLDMDADTRSCEIYLDYLRWPVPIKSACVACPFRSDASWYIMKHQSMYDKDWANTLKKSGRHPRLQQGGFGPGHGEWEEAVEFDERLRWPDGKGVLNKGTDPSKLKGAQYPAYVHPSCKPLKEVDLERYGKLGNLDENFGGNFC